MIQIGDLVQWQAGTYQFTGKVIRISFGEATVAVRGHGRIEYPLNKLRKI